MIHVDTTGCWLTVIAFTLKSRLQQDPCPTLDWRGFPRGRSTLYAACGCGYTVSIRVVYLAEKFSSQAIAVVGILCRLRRSRVGECLSSCSYKPRAKNNHSCTSQISTMPCVTGYILQAQVVKGGLGNWIAVGDLEPGSNMGVRKIILCA